jgi:hypothetical protein
VRTHCLPLTVIGAALVFAAPSQAQFPGGSVEGAIRSNTAGFAIGAYLNGTAAKYEDDSIESGGGLALRIGYGFNHNVELFAEFAAASLQHDGLNDRYGVGHFDLGARYNFGQNTSRTRPYFFGGLSGRAISLEIIDADMRGAGFSAGGGLRHFFNPALALDVGLGLTVGSLSEGRAYGGSWQDLGSDSLSMTSSRFNLGLSWHP